VPEMLRRIVDRRGALPFLWLALSILWAAVIFVTDEPAWVLALWIATTLGPLTALRARRRKSEAAASSRREEAW
jgi:hypothetical protein